MIESIKACSYDKPKNNKPAEDVAEFEGDDPYDDLRYAADSAERYYEEAASEFEKLQAQDRLIQRLSSSGDFTAFYRNMRTVEGSQGYEPIRRFHHARR